jgi:hypothetical protein
MLSIYNFLSYFPGACHLQWQVGISVVGEDPDIPRNASKLPLIPAVKLFLRGCVSDEDTHSSTSCRFLAHLRLIIIMMEVLCGPRGNTWWTRSSTPGIRRLVLLTLVWGTHTGELYSASTLVLFEVLLAVGMGAHGRPLNSNWMLPECSISAEYSLNVPLMFPLCTWVGTHWSCVSDLPRQPGLNAPWVFHLF